MPQSEETITGPIQTNLVHSDVIMKPKTTWMKKSLQNLNKNLLLQL